jgi:hypothetical protein
VDRNAGLRNRSVWRTAGGVGLAFDPLPGVLAYGLVDVTFDLGPDLSHNTALGPGGMLGVYLSPQGERYRAHVYGQAQYFAVGEVEPVLRAGLAQRLTLTRSVAVVVDANYNWLAHRDWLVGRASLAFYF